MSALRDIRLLVARHLDQPSSVKQAVLRVLLSLDLSLDANGYENPPEVESSLEALERAVIGADVDCLEDTLDEEHDIPDKKDALSTEWIDIDDLILEEDDEGN